MENETEQPKPKSKLHIVQPHRQPSKRVMNLQEIREDVDEMHKLILNMPGKQEGYAIHHSQVSDKPFNFFVVHPKMQPLFQGYSLIVNPKILERSDPRGFAEKCLSYPFRGQKNTKRYYRMRIQCEVEHDLGGMLRLTILDVESIVAYIFQHEIEHAQGKFIYDNK